MNRHLNFCLLLGCLAIAPYAHAERADREKPMVITAKGGTHDPAKGVQVLEGNVTIEKGTLRITADRGETRTDAERNVSGTVTGSPVQVRQKREGCEAYIESQAERVEFDEGKDTLKLISRARIKSGDDEITGDVILYNTVTEVFQVQGSGSKAADGLVRMVIQPKESGKDPCAKKTRTAPAAAGK